MRRPQQLQVASPNQERMVIAGCSVDLNALKRTGTVWPRGLLARPAIQGIQMLMFHGKELSINYVIMDRLSTL